MTLYADYREVLRMAAYVLAGCAWPGSWCWQRLSRRLRDDGHITDLVGLHDVVLVGRRCAGPVVTGAADRIPERISQPVYLDTGVDPCSPGPGTLPNRFSTQCRRSPSETAFVGLIGSLTEVYKPFATTGALG